MASDFPTSGEPPMIGRRQTIAEWLDYVAGYDFGPVAPSRLVLHHTFVPDAPEWRGLASMRGMQRYYHGLGWTAAPHIYAAPDGIWLFTPMREVGIHAGTGNSGTTNGHFWYSIGLEMVGDFNNHLPSGSVWEAAKAIMGGLSRRLDIPPNSLISFHRDYTDQKSCPGWSVTRPWVIAEVTAWLANQAPPPPEQGPIGTPTPPTEALIELLANQSFSARGNGYDTGSAFVTQAITANLGFPMAKRATLTVDGRAYAFQPFAQDTLYCEIPNWGQIGQMWDLLGGSIPPAGLGRALLEATYQTGGAVFDPDKPFNQYAVLHRVGPPVGNAADLVVSGVAYRYQVYALDTLYCLAGDEANIRLLSELAGVVTPAEAALRQALQEATYRAGGAIYHPDWAFHQLAWRWQLGCPISPSSTVSSGNDRYAIQVFATDTLYNLVPNWSDVHRLSLVLRPAHFTAFGIELPSDQAPPPPTLALTQFSIPYGAPALLRAVRRITEVITVQAAAGPAEERMRAMLAPGTPTTVHFYVAHDGIVYQLADIETALRHSGLGVWNGRRRNLNLISVAVAVEAGEPSTAQQQALDRLLLALRARYGLPEDAILYDTQNGSV